MMGGEPLPQIRIRRSWWRRPLGIIFLAAAAAAASYGAWNYRALLRQQARAKLLPGLRVAAATTYGAAKDLQASLGRPASEPETGPDPRRLDLQMPAEGGSQRHAGRRAARRGRMAEDRRQNLFTPVLQPEPPPLLSDESPSIPFILLCLGIGAFFGLMGYALMSGGGDKSKNLS